MRSRRLVSSSIPISRAALLIAYVFLCSLPGIVSSKFPLTELPEKKCRRCGLYEHNTFKPDDVFDEWELCRSSFVDGKYVRLKHNEFNATFVCPQCTAFGGVAAVYKYWRKRKREQDQARFLKLFEEGDDLEDELALGNAIYK
ncbi:hypothetical protein C4D60_Mb05t30120 [Musa balbisiana]|uniref:DUF7953 domain-containing protein n=1 Tax=Musa balbisiana TaxID=52838 RepID=A0A4S8JZV3_MUSBA|nr:hypothetical protein C4D60_Mb05t30120 [Musa balbisiana]